MRGPALTRRQGLALAGLLAGGTAASWLLRQSAPLGRDVAGLAAAREVLSDRDTPAIGPAGADLTMAVFTDYRCPACRAAYPDLLAAIRADGRVRLLVKDWPVFGGLSIRAARVALAAAWQGRYWPVHHRLMTDRRVLDEAVLADIVRAAGADWARLQLDLAEYRPAIEHALARTAQQALALGVPGTPAYLVGSLLMVGARDGSGFERAFREVRAIAR